MQICDVAWVLVRSLSHSIDPFLSIPVAMVFILEVKPSRPVSQFQASLTKLSALLQVGVQFRYNVEL